VSQFRTIEHAKVFELSTMNRCGPPTTITLAYALEAASVITPWVLVAAIFLPCRQPKIFESVVSFASVYMVYFQIFTWIKTSHQSPNNPMQHVPFLRNLHRHITVTINPPG
jgi:hypothetical protein